MSGDLETAISKRYDALRADPANWRNVLAQVA